MKTQKNKIFNLIYFSSPQSNKFSSKQANTLKIKSLISKITKMIDNLKSKKKTHIIMIIAVGISVNKFFHIFIIISKESEKR